MNDEVSPEEIKLVSRRSFARNTVGAAASTFLSASVAPAEEIAHTRPDDLSASEWAQVQARLASLLRVYGDRLSVHEKQRILEILINNQHMLISIRAFTVQNGDASALALRLVP